MHSFKTAKIKSSFGFIFICVCKNFWVVLNDMIKLSFRYLKNVLCLDVSGKRQTNYFLLFDNELLFHEFQATLRHFTFKETIYKLIKQ